MEPVPITLQLSISKIDSERRIAGGWVSVVKRADGSLPPDVRGADGFTDVIDTDEAITKWANALYAYGRDSRAGDLMHTYPEVSRMVELMVFTPDVIAKLGLEGKVPVGAYASFHFPETPKGHEAWTGIKSGKYASFSVGGTGHREVMDG